jgi:hypothetical protein
MLLPAFGAERNVAVEALTYSPLLLLGLLAPRLYRIDPLDIRISGA